MRFRLQEQKPNYPDEWENLIESDDLCHLQELIVRHYHYRFNDCAYRILDNNDAKYSTISMHFGGNYVY